MVTTIKANDKCHNTLMSEMILQDKYEVNFRQYNSINSLLGFYSKLYTLGFHESENMVNIHTINSMLVNIDIFQVVMSMVPHNLQFTRSSQISLLDGNELNFREENLSRQLHLREI